MRQVSVAVTVDDDVTDQEWDQLTSELLFMRGWILGVDLGAPDDTARRMRTVLDDPCSICNDLAVAYPGGGTTHETPVCRRHHPYRFQLMLARWINGRWPSLDGRWRFVAWTKFQRYVAQGYPIA